MVLRFFLNLSLPPLPLPAIVDRFPQLTSLGHFPCSILSFQAYSQGEPSKESPFSPDETAKQGFAWLTRSLLLFPFFTLFTRGKDGTQINCSSFSRPCARQEFRIHPDSFLSDLFRIIPQIKCSHGDRNPSYTLLPRREMLSLCTDKREMAGRRNPTLFSFQLP